MVGGEKGRQTGVESLARCARMRVDDQEKMGI